MNLLLWWDNRLPFAGKQAIARLVLHSQTFDHSTRGKGSKARRRLWLMREMRKAGK